MELLPGLWLLLSALVCTEGMNFTEWKAKYGHHSSNETAAEEAFNKSVASIRQHNSNPNSTYKQKIGRAAGMTEEEKKARLGYTPSKRGSKFPKFRVTISKAPNFLNLTSKMSPVKKQGRCGSCWSMAATATMEYWNKGKVFSDQGILDCNRRHYGCAGGSPSTAFYYAMTSGLADGLQYKYVSGKTHNTSYCKMFEFPPIYTLPKACFVQLNGNETLLQLIVAEFGPVVVSINSRDSGLHNYDTGTFASESCSSQLEDANHAVTIVGYGSGGKLGSYWIVRNSWGTDFGQNGYFQMKRGVNMCGVGNRAWGPC